MAVCAGYAAWPKTPDCFSVSLVCQVDRLAVDRLMTKKELFNVDEIGVLAGRGLVIPVGNSFKGGRIRAKALGVAVKTAKNTAECPDFPLEDIYCGKSGHSGRIIVAMKAANGGGTCPEGFSPWKVKLDGSRSKYDATVWLRDDVTPNHTVDEARAALALEGIAVAVIERVMAPRRRGRPKGSGDTIQRTRHAARSLGNSGECENASTSQLELPAGRPPIPDPLSEPIHTEAP